MWFLWSALQIERLNSGSPHLPLQPMFALGADTNAPTRIQAERSREKEEKEDMARRKLSLREQLKGVRAAIRSKRTPPQLRAGLRKRGEWLAKQIGTEN
jgi:signal transduction histidine kinase